MRTRACARPSVHSNLANLISIVRFCDSPLYDSSSPSCPVLLLHAPSAKTDSKTGRVSMLYNLCESLISSPSLDIRADFLTSRPLRLSRRGCNVK